MNQASTQMLLRVRGLTVHYGSEHARRISAVEGVSFEIAPGEVLGLLGESGCGKTTVAWSLLRLLPPSGRVVSGSILFRKRELLELTEDQLQSIRGAEISMIFQEPEIALNPVMSVGDQIAEVIRAHRPWSRQRCREEAKAVLEQVHLPDVARIYQAYSHQLSGGQRQRVVIGLAIACRPGLVIADEPTTALDATVEAEILSLLNDLRVRLQMAFLLITHNPAILASVADRVLVMYAGRMVEEGSLPEVLRNPLHPYTQGLLRCLPELAARGRMTAEKPLPLIAGSPPDPATLPPGCPFEPRCPDRMEICSTRKPEEVQPETRRRVRCFKYGG